jgi:hypothetical protein
VRLYSAANEETLRARKFLKDWASEGYLTEAQHQRLKQETVCDLRTTNIFLRLVLFLFTLIIVVAAVALFFAVFTSYPSQPTVGVFLLIFAAACYAGAELAVSKARLYRYGIEEALAVCSVGLLCAGMDDVLVRGGLYPKLGGIHFLVPAAGAVLSLWIWRRFGLEYAFLAAMIFILSVASYWTSSESAQHVFVAVIYATGLAIIAAVRPRHSLDYLNDDYSLVEAFLWLGIYLAINLQLSSLNLLERFWEMGPGASTAFSRPFYWATWVLTWCLPPIVLARGVLRKDRFVIAVGAIVAILTLVTNKPYLGWPRHTWDPMLLGILLIGVALFIRRWLARGPGGIRRGFTAERLSGKDKHWMNAGSAAFSLLSPAQIMPSPQPSSPDVHFGGGDSGGGGATSDF